MVISVEIIDRYIKMIEEAISESPNDDQYTSYSHLIWMLNEIKTGEMQYGKSNRWLGFVQGIIIERGLTTINEERDFTRPFFHEEFTSKLGVDT